MFDGDPELGDSKRICVRIVSLKVSIRSTCLRVRISAFQIFSV